VLAGRGVERAAAGDQPEAGEADVDPLARTTSIVFPGCSVLMEKNTETPVNEST